MLFLEKRVTVSDAQCSLRFPGGAKSNSNICRYSKLPLFCSTIAHSAETSRSRRSRLCADNHFKFMAEEESRECTYEYEKDTETKILVIRDPKEYDQVKFKTSVKYYAIDVKKEGNALAALIICTRK